MLWLRHQREDEQSEAEAAWSDHVLVKEASPTEAQVAAIDGDVEISILEIDRRCPIARAKKGCRIPEAGIIEKRLV